MFPENRFHLRTVTLLLAAAGATLPPLATAADIDAPTVEVVGLSPIKGLEQARDEVPAHVQSLGTRVLDENRMQPLPELLGSRISGINVNEIQGNPYQADVNFRGFSASPLLGTPQGISVYQDGVRINEPFGDSVNWDLVPRAAIASIDLIPGSNPLFGLNTLGGALSIRTKDGFAHPGAAIEASGGSFGRREIEAGFGGQRGDLGLFVAGSQFREDGWRDFSPSRVDQIFLKLSQQRGPLEWDLAYTHANTDLVGNGLLPDSMLQARRRSIFTKPDQTRNRLHLLSLGASCWLDDKSRLTGTLYHRSNRVRTLNGDANDAFEGDAALDGDAGANGGLGFNTDTAASNRTATDQRSWGGALQWSRIDDNNHVAFGLTADFSSSTFAQTTELGSFDSQRGVSAGGAGEVLNNRLTGKSRSWGLFATDTYKPWTDLALTTSLRLNQTRVTTRDELRAAAPNLDGDHPYTKLNPAFGATWTLSPGFSVFANAAQGNRAPSPIELGCADRANPCSLPNAMQADPFLEQVVTQTFEAGARGKAGSLRWNATLYRADNRDDILFVGTSTSQGYFTNFGRTRREGIELGASTDLGTVSLRADYGYVKATYQSAACLLAENNSTRGQTAACTGGGQDDEILVQAGNRIPGIPLHSLKLGADWRASPDWTLSADLVAYSNQYLRGNENNAHQPGTTSDILGGGPRSFLGAGTAPAYAVLNLAARVRLDKRWHVSARLNNVFDRHYATAGALAENPFDAAGAFQSNSANWTRESFYAPGAPRSLFVAVNLSIN
ncbi:MAG: TonB-dependent receptor [Sulfuritalea sp.]|nr:TonB-dependent receptor [Sulfuritalea sp.]MDP1985019.1 TonB-dependent receptor [Sulfuritalea sp.]